MIHYSWKVEETTTVEEVLFNSDTLSKVISYLPSIDLLNLALTCKKFGVSNTDDGSIIKESSRIAVQDIATEEQLAALPHYNGESTLANYHYLQLMRSPLAFDQLVGRTEYVSGDKSCVRYSTDDGYTATGTAISNNIMRAGKHYATFSLHDNTRSLIVGVMRPGQATQNARGLPIYKEFFQHFSQNMDQ